MMDTQAFLLFRMAQCVNFIQLEIYTENWNISNIVLHPYIK